MRKSIIVALFIIASGCSTTKTYHYVPERPKPYVKIKDTLKSDAEFVNNNPFNIRRSSNNWKGKIRSNRAFELFVDKEHGLRAGFKLIRNYNYLYGIDTIEGLIYRFAPPCENDTEKYISFVSSKTGFNRSEIVDLHDRQTLIKISKYMIQIESGIRVDVNYLNSIYLKFFNTA